MRYHLGSISVYTSGRRRVGIIETGQKNSRVKYPFSTFKGKREKDFPTDDWVLRLNKVSPGLRKGSFPYGV